MTVRSLTLVAARVVATALALVVLLLTPVVVEGPSGRSYEPLGIAIDLLALIVLIAVAWTVFGPRLRRA